jgi:hypothetical protein
VIPLSDFSHDAPFALRHFTETDTGAFSACTVFNGTRRTIVHNDAHSLGRQASDITHELGHALLLHEPTAPLDDRGCRLWKQNVEDEAQWLASALLITEDAALWIARDGLIGARCRHAFRCQPANGYVPLERNRCSQARLPAPRHAAIGHRGGS